MGRRLIRDYEELLPLVDELGVLPLFPGIIPRFSLWDYTRKKPWFTGDQEYDPWFWRQRCASEGRLAYGKFFNGKAGFVSLKLFPDLVNFRRDGKTFDENYLHRRLPLETKAIMEQFSYGNEYRTPQLKKLTGVTKLFDQRVALLQHRTFLVTCDFIQKRSKSGRDYGWAVAVVCKPESLLGSRFTLSRFSVSPKTSYETLLAHCAEILPKIPEKQWKKFLS